MKSPEKRVSIKEFVSQYINEFSKEGVKIFPDDFANLTDTKQLDLPNKTIVMGNEFFGEFEITTTDGTPVYQAADINEAKYIVYASRKRSGKILIPKKSPDIKGAVEKYEDYLDSVLHDIEGNFLNEFPNSPELHATTNEVFSKLGLVRL